MNYIKPQCSILKTDFPDKLIGGLRVIKLTLWPLLIYSWATKKFCMWFGRCADETDTANYCYQFELPFFFFFFNSTFSEWFYILFVFYNSLLCPIPAGYLSNIDSEESHTSPCYVTVLHRNWEPSRQDFLEESTLKCGFYLA